ncbi:hypothetical protein KI387_022010, partial [Taxus chinensis]
QVQNMAVPKNASDPYLREWVKIPENPIMVPVNGINASSFRDPTTAWRGNDGPMENLLWVISRIAITREGPSFTQAKISFAGLKSSILSIPLKAQECGNALIFILFLSLEIMELDNSVCAGSGPGLKHVLKVSLDDNRFEYYTVGTYFPNRDRYVPDDTSADNKYGLRYDYGKFYASKTFFDYDKNRRILWGWINESDSVQDDIAKGWSGVQAIPRTIWLDNVSKSRLMQWPVPELESLREKKTYKDNIILSSGSAFEITGLKAAQVDVEVSFTLPSFTGKKKMMEMDATFSAEQLCSQSGAASKSMGGPFGLLLLASKDLAEHTSVFFRVGLHQNEMKLLMCSDQSRSSLQADVDKTTYGSFVHFSMKKKSVSLRVLVDHSIVESFAEGGKTCITSRVYPTLAIGEDAHLFVFNNATSSVTATKLTAWDMGSTPPPG